MKPTFSVEALADAEHAADWYIELEAWSAAIALHLEITRAVARAVEEPGLGTPGPDGTRVLPIHRLPVSWVYRVEGDVLLVIAVAAQRRRPGHWIGRD